MDIDPHTLVTSPPPVPAHPPFYPSHSPLWIRVWRGPPLNFNLISDLFFGIDLHLQVILRGGLIWIWTSIWNKERKWRGEMCPSAWRKCWERSRKQSDRDGGGVRATALIRSTSADVMTPPVPSHFLFNSENFIRRKSKWIMQWPCWDGWQVVLPAG